ncbi:MAG: TetR/AcrR family transcriptional regulator [Sciscionella sp.]
MERTRDHVLAQARDLLASSGPAAVTYTELAARARVTRQTLYRHWPTREALFIDLVLERALPAVPAATGTPEHVVRTFLRSLRDGMDDPANAAALTALIAQADHDATSRAALSGIVEDVRAAVAAALGSTGSNLDAEDYARLCGPVLFQRFFARQRVSDQFIDHLVASWSQSRP